MDQQENTRKPLLSSSTCKFRDECLSAAAIIPLRTTRFLEEDIPQHAREKMRKIAKLINGIERELFEAGTEVSPPGSSQLPPEGDRQVSQADDSQREKIQVKESNSSLPLQGSVSQARKAQDWGPSSTLCLFGAPLRTHTHVFECVAFNTPFSACQSPAKTGL